MKNVALVLGLIMVLFVASCKKGNEPEPTIHTQQIDLSISYKVDEESFMENCMMYQNKAGNEYSITKLVYYISQVSLIKADSGKVLLKNYHYVDAMNSSSNLLVLKDVPVGNYIGISFNIGLDSAQNISDGLPATTDNVNMKWPNPMGGGYHFLKLEGYYKDTTATPGYAMHLGTNSCLVPIKLFKPINVTTDSKIPLGLVMNINEWYKNPTTFDFNKDGNYIMGNAAAMKKITDNGRDVFSF